MSVLPPVSVSASNIGIRFVREWIFRRLNLEIKPGEPYAITGPNGSGKSTLLQILAGFVQPSEGQVAYNVSGKPLNSDHIYQHVSMASPYMELIEDFTLPQLLQFHTKFKPLQTGQNFSHFADLIQLSGVKNKPIKQFSSGMKQRVKLGLALFSHSGILLLDEPTANLDTLGVEWYKTTVVNQLEGRCVLIGSNITQEYSFCNKVINITAYK
jgi:ABC-type multidrug transport system ATPase subunit